MTTPLERPATPDRLFLWVMHRFAEVFEQHAILKGGMALRLYDCLRSTTDIDYVFVPFESKNEIKDRIEAVLGELEEADVEIRLHSKMLRATVQIDDARIQIEANVSPGQPSTAVPTGDFAIRQGQPSRIVRVLAPSVALAHKLAAWNERRLARDLYDVYFLAGRLGELPDLDVLDARLAKVESRLPALKKRKRMTRQELASDLNAALEGLDEKAVQQELAAVLPPDELNELIPRIRGAVNKLIERAL